MPRKYPTRASKALIIDRSYAFCGNCGRGAYPEQETHVDVAGWVPELGMGCGVRFEHVTSLYAGEDAERTARNRRIDLEWLDLHGEGVELMPGAATPRGADVV